ncbi:hypothetical protein CAAN4_C04566 [[Candida] anglica]|uniref:Palmitoyltransferase n=1 Tax=[Candida] anglica TaxID=148631 RepID=A0ABP0EBJ9_9ASCO
MDSPVFHFAWVKKIVPLLVLGLLGYGSFVAFYSLGYLEIYTHHSHGVAITLWVILGLSVPLVLYYWASLLLVGPGKAPKFQPFDLYGVDQSLATPPQYFMCDENGFPFWCSNCQSLKLPRSLHSKDMGYCVLKFDHYCVWVGTVIGQDNYIYFLKFVWWVFVTFFTALIFLAVYTKDNADRGLNHNFIVLFIFSGMWVLILASLLGSQLLYISKNMTMLDDVSKKQHKRYTRWSNSSRRNPKRKPRKEDGKRYINLARPIDSHDSISSTCHRAVVQYTLKETPYSYGFIANWNNLWLNGNGPHLIPQVQQTKQFIRCVLMFFIPFTEPFPKRKVYNNNDTSKQDLEDHGNYEKYCDSLNENFENFLQEKIEKGDFYLPQYVNPTTKDNSEDE